MGANSHLISKDDQPTSSPSHGTIPKNHFRKLSHWFFVRDDGQGIGPVVLLARSWTFLLIRNSHVP